MHNLQILVTLKIYIVEIDIEVRRIVTVESKIALAVSERNKCNRGVAFGIYLDI